MVIVCLLDLIVRSADIDFTDVYDLFTVLLIFGMHVYCNLGILFKLVQKNGDMLLLGWG